MLHLKMYYYFSKKQFCHSYIHHCTDSYPYLLLLLKNGLVFPCRTPKNVQVFMEFLRNALCAFQMADMLCHSDKAGFQNDLAAWSKLYSRSTRQQLCTLLRNCCRKLLQLLNFKHIYFKQLQCPCLHVVICCSVSHQTYQIMYVANSYQVLSFLNRPWWS